MKKFETLIKKIDNKLLAIDRHLVSGWTIDYFFREYLISLRSSLKTQKVALLKQYSLLANTPRGDQDIPEMFDSEDSPERSVPVHFQYNNFPLNGDSIDMNSSDSHTFESECVLPERTQVYKDKVFSVQCSRENPFLETNNPTAENSMTRNQSEATKLSQNHPETSVLSSLGHHRRYKTTEMKRYSQELVKSIAGINRRNISYVLDTINVRFHQPCHFQD